MIISPLTISNVSSYVDRLKQGGGNAHGNTFDIKKVNKSIGSKFSELLDDPMVQMGQAGSIQNFLGIGSGKDANEMTALDSAMLGSMNLINAKALCTLTKVLGDEQNPFASMFRTISAPEGNALRMPVNRSTSPTVSPDTYAQISALLNESGMGGMGGVGGMDIVNELEAIRALQQPANAKQPASRSKDRQVTGTEPVSANDAAGITDAADVLDPTDLFDPVNMTDHSDRAGQIDGTPFDTRVGRAPSRLGSLAALFESGGDGGIAAIGFDRRGGTSYGKYQMSSRAGTVDGFINYLDSHAPDIASQLKKAGRANTGSRFGNMPETWKGIASTQPKRFEDLQDKFIHSNNFSPAFKAISKAMNLQHMNPAMQEVLFSTAVQHGPRGAVRIFAKAFGRTGGYEEGKEASFIRNVYKIRQTQFSDSSEGVQRAVQGRLGDELRMALSMLEQSDHA